MCNIRLIVYKSMLFLRTKILLPNFVLRLPASIYTQTLKKKSPTLNKALPNLLLIPGTRSRPTTNELVRSYFNPSIQPGTARTNLRPSFL